MVNSQDKKQTAKSIWLDYFNNYLYEHRVITETERNKMAFKIYQECHAVPNVSQK